MGKKALTFEFTVSGGNRFQRTFVAPTAAIAWLKAARHIHRQSAGPRVVGVRLLTQRLAQTARGACTDSLDALERAA
jgi:hypothetical protein